MITAMKRVVSLSVMMTAVLVAGAMTGCATSDPRVVHGPSPEEQVLIAQLGRDPYLIIKSTRRNELGQLEITTDQGGVSVRYLLAPAVEGGRELRLRPIDERLQLNAVIAEQPGTGPVFRGLVR